MYSSIQSVHSLWAYLLLIVVVVAFVNALAGAVSKRDFVARDFRISLFALIVTHIQIVIGIVLFFLSPWGLQNIQSSGMGAVMKDSLSRLYVIEHPLMMIIAVIFLTIGYSRHKKHLLSRKKFVSIALFYGLALIFILSRIPWSQWI